MATVRGLSNKSNALAKESPYCWRRIFPPLTGAQIGQAGPWPAQGRPGGRSIRPQGLRRPPDRRSRPFRGRRQRPSAAAGAPGRRVLSARPAYRPISGPPNSGPPNSGESTSFESHGIPALPKGPFPGRRPTRSHAPDTPRAQGRSSRAPRRRDRGRPTGGASGFVEQGPPDRRARGRGFGGTGVESRGTRRGTCGVGRRSVGASPRKHDGGGAPQGTPAVRVFPVRTERGRARSRT